MEKEERDKERAADKSREEKILRSLKETPVIPELVPAPLPVVVLPRMSESEEITEFLPKFELALELNKVHEEQWRPSLTSHVPIDSLVRVKSQIDGGGITYDDLVGALSSSSTLTFSAAAEDLCTGERGKLWELSGRKATARIRTLLSHVAKDADTKQDMIDCITVALVRDRLVPTLKGYVDTSRRFNLEDFLSTCEEWEKGQPTQTSWFRKTKPHTVNPNRPQGGSNFVQSRRPVTCLSAGPVLQGRQRRLPWPQQLRLQLLAPAAKEISCVLGAKERGISPRIARQNRRAIGEFSYLVVNC